SVKIHRCNNIILPHPPQPPVQFFFIILRELHLRHYDLLFLPQSIRVAFERRERHELLCPLLSAHLRPIRHFYVLRSDGSSPSLSRLSAGPSLLRSRSFRTSP